MEFEKFDEKEFPEPRHALERQIIYSTIDQMGHRGAKPYYFRPEREAIALPGQIDKALVNANREDFGLRLYGGFIRPNLVLLLNGDIKTKQNPEDCPNVRPHFRHAVAIMKKLLKAEKDGFVHFTSQGILIDQDYDIEI